MRIFTAISLIGVAIVAPIKVFGAACCGGGTSFPSLILSDDRAQLGITGSVAKTIGDAPVAAKPVFRSSSDQEWVQSYSLDAAFLISDRWQLGGALPYVGRSRSTSSLKASDWGLGDVSGTVGYEFLPEFSYSRWQPRGFSFFQLTLPTGGNVYESQDTFAVDAKGYGFYALSAGVFLIKSWGAWDSSFRLAINSSLNRAFKASDGSTIYIRPGLNGSVAFGGGYSPGGGDFRVGININPVYTAPTNIASHKLVWNTTLDLSYLIQRSWAVSAGYSDQTLLGPAENTSLQRLFLLSLLHKWER